MFRPQIQKTRILVSLTLLVIAMVYWAVNSFERETTYGYELKKNTVGLMVVSIDSLRSEFLSRNINTGKDSLSFGSFLIAKVAY